MAVFRSIEPFQGSGFEGISEFLIFIGLPAVAFAVLGSQCIYSDIVPCPLVMGDLKTRDCFFRVPFRLQEQMLTLLFVPVILEILLK